MVEMNNNQNFQEVNSNDEIMKRFDEFLKNNKISLSREQAFDFVAKISYFFNNSSGNKLTPYFNNAIGKEKYNGEQISHRSLYTVPKDVEDYYEYGKGNLVPFCKFSAIDEKHSSRNDFYIYVDVENELVFLSLNVVKEIVGKSGKVFAEEDFGVYNYCIPKISTLIRGKVPDVMKNNSNAVQLKTQYNDFEAYRDVIRKSVISMSRVDTNCRHPNKFEFLPNMSEEKLKVARQFFKEKAEEPHLHFCNKGYILNHKDSDSSAIAISVKDLSDYLLALKIADKNDVILSENFGMPFVEMRKKQIYFDYETVKNLTNGLQNAYENFTKQEKIIFEKSFLSSTLYQAKEIEAKFNKEKAREFENSRKAVYQILTNSPDIEKSKDYVNIDAITLLLGEIEVLNVLASCDNVRSKISNKSNIAYNDFFLTINESLGRKKFLHKKKASDYYQKYYNYENGFGS